MLFFSTFLNLLVLGIYFENSISKFCFVFYVEPDHCLFTSELVSLIHLHLLCPNILGFFSTISFCIFCLLCFSMLFLPLFLSSFGSVKLSLFLPYFLLITYSVSVLLVVNLKLLSSMLDLRSKVNIATFFPNNIGN